MPAQTHDFYVGTLPLRLVPRETLQKEPHERDPVPFLAPQISSTAELTYADIDRRREVAFAMDSFHDGLAEIDSFSLARQHQFRYSKGADTSFPSVVLCGPKVTALGSVLASEPTKAIQRGDITYVAAGTRLYQITDSTTATIDTTFGNAITDLAVFGANLVVALGASNDIQYRASDTIAGAFTTLTGFEAAFLVVDNDTIWRAKTTTLHSTDVLTGVWADYEIGEAAYDITGLDLLTGGVLLIGKEDGIYVFDSQFTAQNITPEYKLQADAQVGKVHAIFNRDAYFSTRKGIVRIAPGEGLEVVDKKDTQFANRAGFIHISREPNGDVNGVNVCRHAKNIFVDAGHWTDFVGLIRWADETWMGG